MSTSRIGIAFTGGLTPVDVVECVKLAEDLGYESAWVAEGHGRLMAESGFAEGAAAIKRAWDTGDRAAAARAVPDALVDAVSAVGTPAEVRARVEAYRAAGLALPIISPRLGGPEAKTQAMEAIRACAP